MIEQYILSKLNSLPKQFKLNQFTRWGKNNRYWALVKNNYCIFGDMATNEKYTYGNKPKIDSVIEQFDNTKIIAYWDKIKNIQASTPYLDTKGIKRTKDVKLMYDTVYIPYVSFKHGLSAIQEISQKGNKMFTKGSKLNGSFYKIGELKNKIYMVEGYATGVSLSTLVNNCVVVTGGSTNVRAVYTQLRLNGYQNITGIPDNDDISYEVFKIMPTIKLPTVITGHDVNDVIKYNKDELIWKLNYHC